MSRMLCCALLWVGCTTAVEPPVVPADVTLDPAADVAVLPVASSIRTLTAETVRKAFEPKERRSGPDGLECAAFVDRVILTRPSQKGSRELRIRPRDIDLETDCGWEGPVLVETRVEGKLLGVVWPYLVFFAPGDQGVGRLQVVQGTTGGTIAEMIEVIDPVYARSLTLSFGVPSRVSIEMSEGESCEVALNRAWREAIPKLRESGRVAAELRDQRPTCPAELHEACDVAFVLPFELMLGKTSASPVAGHVGCIGVTPTGED